MANRGRGNRMTKGWNGIGGTRLNLTGDGTTVGNGVSLAEIFGTATVMRIFGEYVITPTLAPAALDECRITLALGVFNSDAFTLGSTAMPDPGSEPQFPWVYWAEHAFYFGTTDADPTSAASSVRRSFDVKGMRKQKQSEALGWVVQYADITGAPPMSVSLGGVRLLFAT